MIHFCNFPFRVVTFLRFLRIIILVRVFRLAAQKKELEKVTRRMVRSSFQTQTGQLQVLGLASRKNTGKIAYFSDFWKQAALSEGWIWPRSYLCHRQVFEVKQLCMSGKYILRFKKKEKKKRKTMILHLYPLCRPRHRHVFPLLWQASLL